MKKDKMKIWKKILILISIIILIFFMIVLIKYNVLTKMVKNYEKSQSLINYYYYSQSEDTIVSYWQKGNVKKLNLKNVNNNTNTIFWKDESLGEEIVVWEQTNKYAYSADGGNMIIALPCSTYIGEVSLPFPRFLLALNPTLIIKKDTFKENECYTLKNIKNGNEEKVDVKTALLLYSGNNGNTERTVEYSFDTVTDEDVIKPDITQYELLSNN